MSAPRPLVIVGPTGGGTSALAAALAEHLEGVVVSADSMQIYQRMDAGTAKPDAATRARAPHHLIDLVEPTKRFTVADWLEHADEVIARAQAEGHRPVVVGGTNLYIRALLEGLFEGPAPDPERRAALAAEPAEKLHAELQRADPESAARIHRNDRKRLVRALEVQQRTGVPLSQWQRQWSDAPDAERRYRHDPVLLGLRWSRGAVNERINRRVKAMFYPERTAAQEGGPVPAEPLPAETRRLEAQGALGPQARQALGYKQALNWVHGHGSVEEAFEQTKIQTRRFARKQRTWLKRFQGVHWLEVETLSGEALLRQALERVEGEEARG
jgi:tRNA dimethylallyltransferase